MGLSLLTPYEFYTLHTSYTYLRKSIVILNNTLPEIVFNNKNTLAKLDCFIEEYEKIFLECLLH